MNNADDESLKYGPNHNFNAPYHIHIFQQGFGIGTHIEQTISPI